MWVQSLGWEDPLEQKMATYSSIPAWKNSMGRGAWQATVHEVAKNWAQLSMQTPLHANEQIQTNSDYPFLFFK